MFIFNGSRVIVVNVVVIVVVIVVVAFNVVAVNVVAVNVVVVVVVSSQRNDSLFRLKKLKMESGLTRKRRR